MIGLTPQQRDALLVIQELTAQGRRPTWIELAAELGMAGKSSVNRMLGMLRDRGRLTWTSSGCAGAIITVLAPLPMPSEDFAFEITPAGRRALAPHDNDNG